MKLLSTFCLIIFSTAVFSQQLHTVTASDFQFSPDSLYLNVGDTIVLNSLGYHSITQVDSLDWENNTATDNGGFWVGFGAPTTTDTFIINTVGTHYYNCNPHASMGMKGVIFSSITTDISSLYKVNDFTIFSQQNGNLLINYKDADLFELYNISGQLILTSNLLKSENNKTLSYPLASGIYIGVFKNKGEIILSKKLGVR